MQTGLIFLSVSGVQLSKTKSHKLYMTSNSHATDKRRFSRNEQFLAVGAKHCIPLQAVAAAARLPDLGAKFRESPPHNSPYPF